MKFQPQTSQSNGEAAIRALYEQVMDGWNKGSGKALKMLKEELKGYDTSNTVIRFAPYTPLRTSLVKKIVKIRIEEINSNRAE